MEDTKKQISIFGTNNRYQIKKLTKHIKEKEKRKTLQHINLTNYSYEIQQNIIKNNLLSDNKIFIQEIKHKISSYKNQDISKNILSPSDFITFEYVIELLRSSNLTCYYCYQSVYILYEMVRENMQWTLDRIDNNIGHNKENVIISCLECNLKRRNQNSNSFLFTKNLKITRENFSKDQDKI
jgi:hypothetical protein